MYRIGKRKVKGEEAEPYTTFPLARIDIGSIQCYKPQSGNTLMNRNDPERSTLFP